MPEYGDLPHPCGTVSGWHRGCRCGECRGAHAAEVARYRDRQAGPRPSRPGAEGPHPLGPDAGADSETRAPAPPLGAGVSPEPASTAPPGSGSAWHLVGLVLILVLIAVALRRGERPPPPAPPWRPRF